MSFEYIRRERECAGMLYEWEYYTLIVDEM
jgi:hypothetical protein